MSTAYEKNRVNKASRLQAFLHRHISASPMSQREMAQAVGYANQNMITILKQGDVKLALDRVPAMAKVLNVDPKHLFALALEQYYGFDNANMIMTMLDQKPLQPETDADLEITDEKGNKTIMEVKSGRAVGARPAKKRETAA